MLNELAARVQAIKPSPTLSVAARADELAASGKDIISLSVGEPDFDTPKHICEAAIAAIKHGQTRYTAVEGTASLKRAIIQKFQRDNQLDFSPNEIIVSCGAKHSIYNLFAALLNPNDEIIIPAPYWVSYPDMAKLMGAHPVSIKTTHTQQFKITPAQLQAAITDHTRIIMLNSPSNPTGVSYTKNEWIALADVLLQYPDIVIATDDIYEHTQWSQEKFCNILMACPALRERCVVINGVSKTYAMTGWRIGYTAGPAKIIAAMKKIQSQSTSNPCSISQAAAEAALNGDQSCTIEMTKAFHARHDYLVAELQKIPGIVAQPCDGTFYTFPSFEKWIEMSDRFNDDIGLAEYLLDEVGVAVVPGSAFGAPGYLRISYATSMEKLQQAVQRFKAAAEKLNL
ncbi:MAG: pyridoxal phosphate-dependent aminotransferase [Gammaproteobacteria bacterium]|nr:pyridoxal phosphate-dependent aminotransferase [Gammaproteobacteria bacterium]